MRNFIFICTILLCFLACNSNRNETVHIPNRDYDRLLDSLNISLPEVTAPVANFVHITQAGKTLYLAGKGMRLLG